MISDIYKSWLCLKTAPELPQRAILRLLERYPDPHEFVGNLCHPLYADDTLKDSTKKHLQNANLPANTAQILNLMQHYQISCYPLTDSRYPDSLRQIFSPPLLLYVRGELETALSAKTLAVVGTRKTSSYGREMTKKLIAPLCEKGVTIISGLAAGIDTIAHYTALEKGSKTVAVLACGLENIYPPQNKDLSEKIIKQGALISEYEPGTKLERWNFPARNRIISAISTGVLITEGPISSGAMLTAKYALEQNRDVFAMPGNINSINSEGPNYLIKNGAMLISSYEDLFYYLGIELEKSAQMEIPIALNPDEQVVYDFLKEDSRAISFDEILIKTGFPIGKISTILTNLELKNIIAKESGNSFFIV